MGKAGTKYSSIFPRIAIALVLVAGLAAFFALGGDQYLNLSTLKSNRDWLQGQVQQHYLGALLLAMLVYATAIALSIPGGALMSLAMGFLFGRWMGTAAIVIAATVGAMLVFLAARYLLAEALTRRIGPRAQKISEGFRENAFNYLLFLRLVPLFPFWLVNVVPALAAVNLRTYVLATAIGIVPGSFVFANLGLSLARIESTRELLSGEVLTALLLLGVFALVPVFVKKRRAAKAATEAGGQS